MGTRNNASWNSLKALDSLTNDPAVETASELAILSVLVCHYANEHGVAWPSIRTLAKKTRTSPATVKRILKKLRANPYRGISIEVTAGDRVTSNSYRFILNHPPEGGLTMNPPSQKVGSPRARGGLTVSQGVGSPRATNNPIEQPKEQPKRGRAREARSSSASSSGKLSERISVFAWQPGGTIMDEATKRIGEQEAKMELDRFRLARMTYDKGPRRGHPQEYHPEQWDQFFRERLATIPDDPRVRAIEEHKAAKAKWETEAANAMPSHELAKAAGGLVDTLRGIG